MKQEIVQFENDHSHKVIRKIRDGRVRYHIYPDGSLGRFRITDKYDDGYEGDPCIALDYWLTTEGFAVFQIMMSHYEIKDEPHYHRLIERYYKYHEAVRNEESIIIPFVY